MRLGGRQKNPKTNPLITVVVADRVKRSRAAVVRLLERESGIRVLGETGDGLEVIGTLAGTLAPVTPRILILGFNLLKGRKIELLSLVRERMPRTKVVLITGRIPELQILEALSRGARGYLGPKDFGRFLIKAVRLVDAGEAWVQRKMVARLVDRLARLTADQSKLTADERR